MSRQKSNKLISEKSPYLLQHAYNPVDWYPWSKEAFEKAVGEDKPIFLSIGYSTCHWCHVMEKESFEDQEVARLMNDTFLSIKVDREERPDLDHIYMTVCQMLTGSGGWPLTIVMTPDKRPFFAATYIPKGTRFGRTGMLELIPRLKEIWSTRRHEVLNSADKIVGALQKVGEGAAGEDLDLPVLEKAYKELVERFDQEYGGFGQAPKFPTPHNFLFLLRYWKRSDDKQGLLVVEKTLRQMRLGGVYDQIGHGFHRYSTDRKWLVPHFEKMLYDQAMLAMAYTEAFQTTGKDLYGNTVREIFGYVLRDMLAPQGGFYSAEDADSEGVEGKFYLWEEAELLSVLGRDEGEFFSKAFNIKREGNFKEETTGRENGTNIPHLKKTLTEMADDFKMSEERLQERIETAREKLFQVREKRIHPHKDDKILTDWNGLMIAALARGFKVFGDVAYKEAAENAAGFVDKHMRRPDGRLLHRYRDGESKIEAHLDDYAFFIWALIELYEATFSPQYLEMALELNKDMLEHYWDEGVGGLYFSPDDGEALIVRKKELYDGAVPSGNAVAMLNCLRLSRITGDPGLDEKASEIVRAFSRQIKEMPSAFTQFMVSADFALGPSYEVVIVGSLTAKDTREMVKAIQSRFIPNHVIIFRPADQPSPEIDGIAEFVKSHVSIGGLATAYVCLNNACKTPTTDIREMLSFLYENPSRRR